MLKKYLFTFLIVTGVLFCGCTVSDSTSTESVSVVVEENMSEETEESVETDISEEESVAEEISTEELTEPESSNSMPEEDVSEETSEEIPTLNETGELNNVIIEIEGNIATVNGREYEIATDEMNYSGGYTYYWIGNSTMEDIMTAVNTSDITKTSWWRDGYVKELQEEAAKDTQLEEFIEAGGTILNYYILNSSKFLHSRYGAEVPIAVEYSINGEVYGTIITFCIMVEYSEDDVYYGIYQVIHTDNLDAYHVYDD